MDREPVPGECVVVTSNAGDHNAQVGERYIVCRVDESDDTIKGIPKGSSAVADQWIPWSDVEPVCFGWDFARRHLPEDVAALLAACDGIEHIALNSRIKHAILDALPNWRPLVMEAIESMDSDPL
jgi:hypothetical protein